MFDFIDEALGINDWFRGTATDLFEPISDYLSGYTSANQAQRFGEQNLALQQMYNVENMKCQQCYNLTNMRKTDEYQRKLMADSPSIQVQALRDAGLNPMLAVGNGITSASTAVHAVNPTSQTPMPSNPSVQPQFGNVFGGISSLFGLGSTVSDMILKSAQTKATSAASAESAARTLKTMKEADALNPELEQKVKEQVGNAAELSAESNAIGKVASLAGSASSAYAAKKSADVATVAIKKGMSKSSAKQFATQVVGARPTTSAVSSAEVLSKFGLLGLPFAAGIFADKQTKKKMSDKDWKDWTALRASTYGY